MVDVSGRSVVEAWRRWLSINWDDDRALGRWESICWDDGGVFVGTMAEPWDDMKVFVGTMGEYLLGRWLSLGTI